MSPAAAIGNVWVRVRWFVLQAALWWKARARLLLGLLLGIVVVDVVLMQFDHVWLERIALPASPSLDAWAAALSTWGDFFPGTILLAALVAVCGRGVRRVRWRGAALACVLAGATAGLTTNVLRAAIGRPRPKVGVPDVFRGPNLHSRFRSHPSSHTGAAFGTASALAVALPPVGIAALVGAAGVGWSRMYMRWHFPADVWAGGSLGVLIGLPLGLAARRRGEQAASGDEGAS